MARKMGNIMIQKREFGWIWYDLVISHANFHRLYPNGQSKWLLSGAFRVLSALCHIPMWWLVERICNCRTSLRLTDTWTWVSNRYVTVCLKISVYENIFPTHYPTGPKPNTGPENISTLFNIFFSTGIYIYIHTHR